VCVYVLLLQFIMYGFFQCVECVCVCVIAAVYNVRLLPMCRWISLHIHIPAAALHQGNVQVLCTRISHFMVSRHLTSLLTFTSECNVVLLCSQLFRATCNVEITSANCHTFSTVLSYWHSRSCDAVAVMQGKVGEVMLK